MYDLCTIHPPAIGGFPAQVQRDRGPGARQEPLFTSTIHYAGERYRLRTSFAR